LKRFLSVSIGLRLLLALSFGLLAAGRPGEPPLPADLILDFVNDIKGAIEPCGCHSGQFGGLARWASYLRRTAGEPGHRMVILGGDMYPEGTSVEMRHKGGTAYEAFARMGVDAVALGDLDFQFGTDVLAKDTQGLPVVTTNLVWATNDQPVGQPMILKTFSGLPGSGSPGRNIRVAVLSIMDESMQPDLDAYLKGDPKSVKILPAVETARQWVTKARAQADVVVVVLHRPVLEAAAFPGQVPGIDVLICGHSGDEVVVRPRRVGSTLIVANGDRGRFLGQLRFNLGEDGRLSEPLARQLDVDASFGIDSTVEALVQKFKTNLESEHGQAALVGRPDPLAPSYTSATVCASCHQDIVDIWSRSLHAHAFATLQAKHDEAREECVRCHTVGFGESGGYSLETPQTILENVQCENCHGSGVKHVISAPEDKAKTIVGHPGPEVCKKCHNATRDPDFDFATRWPRIKH
jgi:2',3'-cyclic-nucleotide 2'-phosphodiesterase (5'-nucleotidase family)